MNEALLQYLLESTGALLLFYLFFWLVLQKETCFQFNRFYLLGALVVAFTLPFLQIPGIALFNEPEPVAMSIEVPEYAYSVEPMAVPVVVEAETVEDSFRYWQLLYGFYALGFVFFAIRFGRQLLQLHKFTLGKKAEFLLPNNARVYYTHGQLPTFSFLQKVFLDNSQSLTETEQQQILAHEQIHIAQRHSYDLLLLSVLKIVFWFNPLLVLYKKALEQTHEFIADAHVVKQAGTGAYAKLLLKQVFPHADFSVGSYFFFHTSLTLRRIKMMKNVHRAPQLGRLLLVIPVLALLLLGISAGRPVAVAEATDYEEKLGATLAPKDQPAQFPGGEEALAAFVKKNFVIPKVAYELRKGQEPIEMVGTLEVEIKEDGTAVFSKAVQLETKPNHGQVQEAVMKEFARLVAAMPKWAAANRNGKAVASKTTIHLASTGTDFTASAGSAGVQQQKLKVTAAAKPSAAENQGRPEGNTLKQLVLYYYPNGAVPASAQKENEERTNVPVKAARKTTPSGKKIYLLVDKMPVFPGGNTALLKHLGNTIRVPADVKKAFAEGEVLATFVVSEDGNVIMPEVVKSLTPDLDKEIIRVIFNFPKWEPGSLNGKPVPVRYFAPIRIEAKPETGAAVSKPAGEKIYIAVEQMPEFPGGPAEMMKFLSTSFKIPADAGQDKVSGTLVGSFVVSAEGKAGNIEVLKGLSPSLDQEFKRVLAAMPIWKPGMQNGKAVAVKYTVPFRVKLTDGPGGTVPSSGDDDKVYIAVEQMPEFPGGMAALMKFMHENYKLPTTSGSLEGTTVVSFVVTKEGNITHVTVMKPLAPALDQEAVRVISSMPNWIPGRQNGKPVNVKYTVPYRISTVKPDMKPTAPQEKN